VEELPRLLPNLHPSDRELLDARGITTLQALRAGFETSQPMLAGCADGTPFCTFGAVPDPSGPTAYVWFMAEEGFERHARGLLRGSRKWIEGLPYEFLHNVSRADNPGLVRWLHWLGFTELDQRMEMAFVFNHYVRSRHV
jgi:hypothetical protein